MEAGPPPVVVPPVSSQTVDPSQPQPQPVAKQSQSSPLQQQLSSSSSNPNPNFSQPANMVQFNRPPPPAWVHLPPAPTAIVMGVPPPNSVSAAAQPILRNTTDSSPSPARPSMSSSMGMIGSHVRPGGVPQHRPAPPANFEGHGILRTSSAALPSTSAPSNSQSQLSSHQPWLAAQHGRPPMASLRPQATSQILQPKAHNPHNPQQSMQLMTATSQPHQLLSSPLQQQHTPASVQSQENYGQQLSSSRIPQSLISQQQLPRVQGSSNQRLSSPIMGQASIMHSGRTDCTGTAEALDSCTRILSKRNIQELVNQVDPLEKLDPEVEDVLVDIADDFIDSVTAFGCSLAKHRKSITLEAKDILLHLERTWNMTLPGFIGDEIKTYKKPVVTDIHKERLVVIKKSLTGAEVNKSSAAPAGNVKGHLAKTTHNIIGS